MKKLRMMLPVLAVVFAVGAAVAGNFFAPITAYRVNGASCLSGITEQENCQENAPDTYPLCTIKVGTSHLQAFANSNCTGILRDVKAQ
jgi:hypothetical protein